MSMGIVTFLKASLVLLSALLRVPGENPRSSDQAVAVLLCHYFLEGTVLGFAVCISLMVI
jgi:hypothetical protein